MKINYYISRSSKLGNLEPILMKSLAYDLKNRKSFVYLPSDPNKHEWTEKKFLGWINKFKKYNIVFENNTLINSNMHSSEIQEYIKNADFILLPGGNPWIERDFLTKNDAFELLKEYKGVLLGSSAGAMNMSKYTIIAPCNDEFPDFDVRNGLNLNNISVFPHFNYIGNKIKEVSELEDEQYKLLDLLEVAKQYGEFYLLQDEPVASALRIANNEIKILGPAVIHVTDCGASIIKKINNKKIVGK